MKYESQIGVSTIRKDAWDKVTGNAKYNGDTIISEVNQLGKKEETMGIIRFE